MTEGPPYCETRIAFIRRSSLHGGDSVRDRRPPRISRNLAPVIGRVGQTAAGWIDASAATPPPPLTLPSPQRGEGAASAPRATPATTSPLSVPLRAPASPAQSCLRGRPRKGGGAP